jgi:GntR family transcriptional regulator, transcriptional repressor for pyruvate dehydrogenase complex
MANNTEGNKTRRHSAIRRVRMPHVGVNSISRHMVERILDKLFTGELHPGDFLGTEQQLAEVFGASRPPVREALGRLHAMGVIAVTTGVDGGARVAQPDPERVAALLAIHFVLADIGRADLMDARIAIEPEVFKLAAESATAQDLVGLRGELQHARACIDADDADFETMCEALSRLHRALGNACHNIVLIGLMRVIERNLFFRYLELRDPGVGRIGLAYFESIFRLIERRQGSRAARRACEHLTEHRSIFRA